MEILRLVRKVADFPSTIYLLCFDRDILSGQVAHATHLKDGHEFVEKILQNIISVPPQEPFALRRYLAALLSSSFPNEMNQNTPDDMAIGYRRAIVLDSWTNKLIASNRSHPSQEFEVARAPAFVIAACE